MKIIKKDEEKKQETSTENYLKKKSIYGRNRYKNMSEENKQRLKEYQKNYRIAKQS